MRLFTYQNLKKQDIKFTLYADDMALSAKKGITGEYIQYICNVLKKHKLTINQAKIKWYSYKKALPQYTPFTEHTVNIIYQIAISSIAFG